MWQILHLHVEIGTLLIDENEMKVDRKRQVSESNEFRYSYLHYDNKGVRGYLDGNVTLIFQIYVYTMYYLNCLIRSVPDYESMTFYGAYQLKEKTLPTSFIRNIIPFPIYWSEYN